MFNKSFQSLQCSKNIHLGGITAGNHHHHPCLDKSPTFSRFFLMESAHLSALPCPAPFFNCLIQNGDLGGESPRGTYHSFLPLDCSDYIGAPVKMVISPTSPQTPVESETLEGAIKEGACPAFWKKEIKLLKHPALM